MVVSKNEHIAAMKEINAAFKAATAAVESLTARVEELEKAKPAPKRPAAKK